MPDLLTDDGVRLHYVDEDFRDPWRRDERTAVLLHHGYAKSLEHWTGFVPAVARHFRVVRFDVRGAGRSGVPPDDADWTLARLVQDASNVIDALGIDKVHWAGAESGGIVGLHFAARHPERIASLGCFNMPYRGSASKEKMTSYFCRGCASPAAAIDQFGYAHWMAGLVDHGVMVDCVGGGVVEWVRQQAMQVTPAVAKAWHAIFWNLRDPFSDAVDKITVPVLLLAGAEHAFGCEPPLLDALRDRLKSAANVVYIPGVGVGVQLLAADACAEAYLRFLSATAALHAHPKDETQSARRPE